MQRRSKRSYISETCEDHRTFADICLTFRVRKFIRYCLLTFRYFNSLKNSTVKVTTISSVRYICELSGTYFVII